MPLRDPIERREYSRRYHLANRERMLAAMKRWARANPEKKRAIDARRNSGIRGRDIARARRLKEPEKVRARVAVSKALAAGQLVRGPCEVCGAAHVEGHHDDYSKPLVVRWLCPLHHREEHGRA